MDIKQIKYVFVDLDGTLLQDDKKLPPTVIETIKRFRTMYHIPFGIATGRALSSLLPLLKAKGLLDYIDVIVANNGVDLYIPAQQKLERKYMLDKTVIEKVLKAFEGEEDVNVCFHNPGLFYAQKVTKRVSNILKINQIDVVFHPNYCNDYTQTPRVMLLFDPANREKINTLIEKVHIDGVRGIQSEPDIYEYVDERVSKVVGIQEYVESFQDTLDQVLVIGDSYNDIEMLQHCGIGVAMKNADEQVKQYADMISEYTNNEDGVAHILSSCWNLDTKERG
ncbi:Cof-type HAD-IIB family hydrolase [Amedibacillus sp. YH-ame6]